MPETALAPLRRLLLGGTGAVRYALPLEVVERVVAWPDLPPVRRVVNLPRLLDLDTAGEEEDRYARIVGLDEPAFLRLGPEVKAVELPEERLAPVPLILGISAARWSWAELAVDEAGRVVIVVDAPSLVRIGARREGSAS